MWGWCKALFLFVFGRVVLIYISLTLTLSLTWSHFIPSSSYHLGIFLPFSLCFPSCLASSLVNLSPATPTLPLPLASALCTPSLLFVYFPPSAPPPPTPLSQPPLFAFALIFHSCCSKTSRHALLKPVVFFLFFFFYPPLILHSHHRNQDQHTPHAQTCHPRLLLCSQLRQNRQREGGGELDKPAENCPSKGNVYVREGRCSHQRIHTQTQRHLAPASVHPLTLFLPVLLPGCTDGSWIPFWISFLFFYCFFLCFARCHTLGLFGSRGCFCEPMPQVNSHTWQ